MSVVEVWPVGSMALLMQGEADALSINSQGEIYDLYRNCSLAVLNCGSLTDNSKQLLKGYDDFSIHLIRNERGLKIELVNPPDNAIVDGKVIQKIRKHLYAVLRDIVSVFVFAERYSEHLKNFYKSESEFITNEVFLILRNAGVLQAGLKPKLAVCFGGHAIPQNEYDYAYAVGHELGLRKIDICTGCGPGVMEAPMKGALQGYSEQDAVNECRLIGLTEPSIIAAEPPNVMVSELVILPNIEKRLEAFIRLSHTMIIFPGGPGTAEELLYLLAIKLCPTNRNSFLPIILTGNRACKPYFDALNDFLIKCFGTEITRQYEMIIDDPKRVAIRVKENNQSVTDHRTILHDSYCFNWTLDIPFELKKANAVTHEFMASLNLTHNQEPWKLACALRSAFSGIVAGNVKESGIKAVEKYGPFKLHGDRDIIEAMDKLLNDFIIQGRILLSSKDYVPCYILEK